MGVIKKIIHILSIICYIFVCIYAIVCIPLVLGYHPVVVLSGSMEPTYKVGSVIYYKEVPEKELKAGDVITFTMNNQYISHRIVSIENGLIETKGDANNVSDINQVSYDNVKGRVAEKSIPYIGYYIRFVDENLIIAIVLILIIFISEFFASNTKAFGINKNKRKA